MVVPPFSAYSLPFVLLLFALIFRAVSLKFRAKRVSPAWRAFWDILCCVNSDAAPLFGVGVAPQMQGLAISELDDYQGTMLDMLTGFSLLVGLFPAALLAM